MSGLARFTALPTFPAVRVVDHEVKDKHAFARTRTTIGNVLRRVPSVRIRTSAHDGRVRRRDEPCRLTVAMDRRRRRRCATTGTCTHGRVRRTGERTAGACGRRPLKCRRRPIRKWRATADGRANGDWRAGGGPTGGNGAAGVTTYLPRSSSRPY